MTRMKRSGPLCACILIVSALVLSAASESATPSPKPDQASEARTPAEYNSRVASPSPTAIGQPAVKQPPSDLHVPRVLSAQAWGDFPGWLQAFATIGLLAFAWWQMWFVRRSTLATEEAAKAARTNAIAAKESADAANQYVKVATFALQSDRPFIFVTKFLPHNFKPASEIKNVFDLPFTNCTMTNYGKGPAIIDKVIAKLEVTDQPLPIHPDFSDCREIRLVARPVVSATEPVEFQVWLDGGQITDEIYRQLIDVSGKFRISLRGVIRYHATFGSTWERTFGCLFVREGTLAHAQGESGFVNFFSGFQQYNREYEVAGDKQAE
jgi:hypothetical protein